MSSPEQLTNRAGVVVFDGTAAPGGGSQAMSLASVQISSAELLALATTPKVLLAAPGDRNYHVVHGMVLHYRFGTTPYTGDFETPSFGFGTTIAEIDQDAPGVGGAFAIPYYAPDALGGNGNALLQQSEDAYVYIMPAFMGGQAEAFPTWNAWLAQHIEDKAWSMFNVPNIPLADGDGTMVVRVWYTTIDGAP